MCDRVQKQPPEVFYKKSCYEIFRNSQRKTAALDTLFNKVAGLQACNFM